MTDSARTISRRSITKGAAWATPVVAVAGLAPSAAATPCKVTFSLGGTSCKCPGGSTDLKFGYFLQICVTPDPGCAPPAGTTLTVVSVKNGSGKPVTSAPTPGFCEILPATITLSGGKVCTTSALRMESASSASSLVFSYTVSGDNRVFTSDPVDAPPQTCTECNDRPGSCNP